MFSKAVQFQQNVAGGYIRGERYEVRHDPKGFPFLSPLSGGHAKPIPYNASSRFEVYTQASLAFAPGDKIRFTLGGKSRDGKRRISNGRLDEVQSFNRAGDLVLKSGMTVSKAYGHFDLGYVVTSHSSQGKDRDLAIAAIGKTSLPAVNAKQFYVTASRGREDLMLFVDDKGAVRRAIQNAGEQLSATELVSVQQTAARRTAIDRTRRQRAFLGRVRDWWHTHFPNRQASTQRQTNHTTRTPKRPGGFSSSPGLSRS